MKLYKHSQKAFTLIELMVVISIISLLSSVVLASLKNARSRSKDSKKIQELVQLRTALELYRSVNNSYPVGTTELSGNCSLDSYLPGGMYTQTSDNWILGLVPRFYSKLPGQNATPYVPLSKGHGNECYVYYSNGTDYKLTLIGGLEVTCGLYDTNPFCLKPINELNSGKEYSASIYSPGAQNYAVTFIGSF